MRLGAFSFQKYQKNEKNLSVCKLTSQTISEIRSLLSSITVFMFSGYNTGLGIFFIIFSGDCRKYG